VSPLAGGAELSEAEVAEHQLRHLDVRSLQLRLGALQRPLGHVERPRLVAEVGAERLVLGIRDASDVGVESVAVERIGDEAVLDNDLRTRAVDEGVAVVLPQPSRAVVVAS
jgi:hypothetical protein